MNTKELMISKKRWAVVGARPDRETMGYKIPMLLEEKGYTVYLVNPNYDEIDGRKVYSSLLDIGEEVDCVDIIVNPKISLKVLDEVAQLGIKYVWFQPGTIDKDVIKKAREYGIEYVKDCVYATLKDK